MTDPTPEQSPWSRPTYGQPAPTQPVYPPPIAYPQPGAYPPAGAYPPPGGYAPPPGAYPPLPTYPQPIYQRGNPPPGTMYVPAAPKTMSGGVKALLIVGPILFVLLLAAIGAGIIGSTTSSTSGTGHSVKPDTFTMPATALGLPRSDDARYASVVEPLSQAMGTHGSATSAGYVDPSDPQDILILLGLSTDLPGQSHVFQNAIAGGLGESLGGTNKQSSYPLGAMGGEMWCEDGAKQSIKVGFCSVGDDGGALVIIYFNHTPNQAASALLNLRPLVEKQP